MEQLGSGSISKFVHIILIYFSAKIGAFIKRCTKGCNILDKLPHYPPSKDCNTWCVIILRLLHIQTFAFIISVLLNLVINNSWYYLFLLYTYLSLFRIISDIYFNVWFMECVRFGTCQTQIMKLSLCLKSDLNFSVKSCCLTIMYGFYANFSIYGLGNIYIYICTIVPMKDWICASLIPGFRQTSLSLLECT